MGIDRFIKKISVQTALYWANPVKDGYGGYTFDSPVEIKVRWEDVTTVVNDIMGKEVVSDAKILTPIDLDSQGYLYLGQLADFDSSVDLTNPKAVDGTYSIVKIEKIPMIKSTTIFVRTIYLKKEGI